MPFSVLLYPYELNSRMVSSQRETETLGAPPATAVPASVF